MGTQTPNANTPVSKCLDLAAFTCQMMSKFPTNTTLGTLSTKLHNAAQKLETTQNNYQKALKDILPTRVDVKFENISSDRRIRKTQQKAELAGKNLALHAFPKGSYPITRLLGASQVEEMLALEGRLASLENTWDEAASEKQAIAKQRDDYDKALKSRSAAYQKAGAELAVRNLEKQNFLLVYEEIVHRVKAEFPGDNAMQELFFDEVRNKSSSQQAEEAEEAGEDTAENTP